MAGGYKAVLRELTILGRMNDINIQARFEVEYDPEKIRFMTMLDDITEKLRLGGLQPPVGQQKLERKWSDRQTRATGEHPLDPRVRLDDEMEPVPCPTCGQFQKLVTGRARTGPNVGQPWVKAVCSNEENCDWPGEFINNKKQVKQVLKGVTQ